MQVFGMPIQFASVAQIVTRRPQKNSSSPQPTEGTRPSGRMPRGATDAASVPSSTRLRLRFRPKKTCRPTRSKGPELHDDPKARRKLSVLNPLPVRRSTEDPRTSSSQSSNLHRSVPVRKPVSAIIRDVRGF